MKRNFIFILTSFLLLLAVPSAVYAGEDSPPAAASGSSSQDSGESSKSTVEDSFKVTDFLTPPGATKPAQPENVRVENAPIFHFISETINFLVAIVGSFSLLIFIIGGIYLLVSEGQEDRIQKGKQAMVFSIIGLAIALMAYAITTIVQSIFF